MSKLEEIEYFEELDAVLDKMRVLAMALEYEDPNDEYKSALSSFATDVVADLEKVVEKNKPKPGDAPVR